MKRAFRNKTRSKKRLQRLVADAVEEAIDYNPENTDKKIGRALFSGLFFGLLIAFICFIYSPTLRDYVYWVLPETHTTLIDKNADTGRFQREIRRVERRIATLKKRLAALIPKKSYIIVDTSGNHIIVMRGKRLVHKGVCSTGSYVLLRASNNRQWIFRTPRGQFKVLSKLYAPVWYMPDWAFVEEGRPIPPRDSPKRFEPGVLGEYALSIGRGYLIHGTLYKRMLGMPVTHGCVRVGDEDLKIVWKNSMFGTKVLIY
ncbi:L,D-transpeptidase [candidate division KSB1 bacterium]|nr:L,D-transpeptidase [candidate division KSB1 bacterium]